MQFIGLVRKLFNPLALPSLDQAEAYDQTAEGLTGSAEWLTVIQDR